MVSNKTLATNFNRTKYIQDSDYAKFFYKLQGYRLYRNNIKLDRWEAFVEGHSAENILKGYTNIKAIDISKNKNK